MSKKNINDNYHLRLKLLSVMLEEAEPHKKEILFYKADNVCSWFHAVSGRFIHMVNCITMLDTTDKHHVLSMLGIDPQFYWIIRSVTDPFNVSHSLQMKIIQGAGHLLTLLLDTPKNLVSLPTWQPPYVPRTATPYAECQVRNLFLYFTTEYRERRLWCVTSITNMMAATVHAYQKLCVAISNLGDKEVVEEALKLTGINNEKYVISLELTAPFICIDERRKCFADKCRSELP